MPKAKEITHEFYEELVEAFREHGANFARVSKAVGCSAAYATRAWHGGWLAAKPPVDWAIPIKEVISLDQIQARIRVAQDPKSPTSAPPRTDLVAEEGAKDAISDAAAARAEEAKAVRLMRHHAIMGFNVLAHVRKFALPKLAQFLIEDIKKLEASGKGMRTDQVLANLRRLEDVSRSLGEQARMAIEMERKILGEPDHLIGFQASNLSVEGAIAAITDARDALERAERRKVITLPDSYWADADAYDPDPAEDE